jgi:subtilisin family serine protease
LHALLRTLSLPLKSVRISCSDAPLSEVRTLPPGAVLAARAAEQGAEGSVTHLREALGLEGRWTGAGVGVAVIDSGLETHMDLPAPSAACAISPEPMGYCRTISGTHVSGLIGGTGTADGQFQGVAPGVTFIVLKVLDADGYLEQPGTP